MGFLTRVATEVALAGLLLGGFVAIFHGYERAGSVALAQEVLTRFYAPIRGAGLLIEAAGWVSRRLQAKTPEAAAASTSASPLARFAASGAVTAGVVGLVWLVYFSGVGTAWMTRPLAKLVSEDAVVIFKTFLKALGDDMNVVVYVGLLAVCAAVATAAIYATWLAATLPLLACWRCCKNAPTSREAAAVVAASVERAAPRTYVPTKPVLEVPRDEVGEVVEAFKAAEKAAAGGSSSGGAKKPDLSAAVSEPLSTHGIGQSAKLKSVTAAPASEGSSEAKPQKKKVVKKVA